MLTFLTKDYKLALNLKIFIMKKTSNLEKFEHLKIQNQKVIVGGNGDDGGPGNKKKKLQKPIFES